MTTGPDAPAVITEPKVYLVGRQDVNDAAMREFLGDIGADRFTFDGEAGDSECLVEAAGRLCYLSFAKPRPGGNAAYVGHILDVAHGSVLEHAVYNLIVTGVSRSFTHELVRHRAGFGFSQLSQRFVDEGECSFVCPPLFAGYQGAYEDWRARADAWVAGFGADPGEPEPGVEAYDEWLTAVGRARKAYESLSRLAERIVPKGLDPTARRKKAREAARSVLPNATETKIFVTLNARAARHFIEMRADPAADAEIRAVALAVLALLGAESPNLFGDYEVAETADGTRHVTTRHRKV